MLPGPQKHLAQLEAPAYMDSPVLPVDVVLEFMVLEFKVLDLETGLLGEQGQQSNFVPGSLFEVFVDAEGGLNIPPH